MVIDTGILKITKLRSSPVLTYINQVWNYLNQIVSE